MYHPRLRGTHYDMGHHYGSLLYKNGFRTNQLPNIGPEHSDFLTASEQLTREVYPEICEEMRGFADGTQGDYLQLAGFLLSIGTTQVAPHCSCFAAVTDIGILFGRNHDYFKQFKKFSESSLVRPEGCHSFVGQGDTFIGKEDGVNELGLAVGYTFVYGKASQPGINFLLAVRGALEKCSNIQEAIDWFGNLPLSTYQNIVFADRSGDIAVLEAGPEHFRVRRPEQGQAFIVATNNFMTDTMRGLQQNEDRNWFEAETRFETVSRALEEKQRSLTLESAQHILAGKTGFVCQYSQRGDFNTLWSVVANLNTLQIWRAEGNPVRLRFKEDKRLIRVSQQEQG